MNHSISSINFNSKLPITQIDNYLIKGPSPTIRDLIELKERGVNQVIDFRENSFKGFKFIEKLVCKICDIKYIRKPCNFFNNNGLKLEDYEILAKNILENGLKGNKTYIHCNSGRHRTGLMALFYELTRGASLAEAKEIYKKTFDIRKKILLNKPTYNEDFHDRKLKKLTKYNFISNWFIKLNNKIVNETHKAKENFKAML